MIKKGRIVRLAAVLLLCCSVPLAGARKSAPVSARGGAKLKVVVMTPYPGSREKTGDTDPVKPERRKDGVDPLPNYEGETLTLGLLKARAPVG